MRSNRLARSRVARDAPAWARLLRSLTGLGSGDGHAEAVQAVAFGPGGVLLAASDLNESGGPVSDGHVAVWRTATGALLAAPRDLGHPGDSLR
jgi:hypothetical protein